MIRDCECGILYFDNSPSDRRRHRRLHQEHAVGVPFRSRLPARPIAREGELAHLALELVVVPPDAPLNERRRVERIGRLANREMHYDFGVYHAIENPDGESPDTALVVRQGCLPAVGLLLLMRGRITWRGYWDAAGYAHAEIGPTWPGRPTVAFLWVLRSLRRQGIARMLAREAARYLGQPVAELAWLTPFSDQGRELARGLAPERIWLGH